MYKLNVETIQGRNKVQILGGGAEFYKWLETAPKKTDQKDLAVFRAFLRGPKKFWGGRGPPGPPTRYAPAINGHVFSECIFLHIKRNIPGNKNWSKN